MEKKRKKYERDLEKLLSEDVFLHSKRVAKYAEKVAGLMGLDTDDRFNAYVSGLYHDVGKALIKSDIWSKQSNLNEMEFKLAKAHPDKSAEYLMCCGNVDLAKLAVYVKHHHEKYDGSGYPLGLSGWSIPQISRILTVCDVFDAMTSIRPYRPFSYTYEKVLESFIDQSGKSFDPEIVSVFQNYMYDIIKPEYNSLCIQFDEQFKEGGGCLQL